jgi:MarR family transcriptional regulator, lower aerobic nicotinate degradation pathway regulator
MPTLAKSSRKPEQLKSKPVKAAPVAKTATKVAARPAVAAPVVKTPVAKAPVVKVAVVKAAPKPEPSAAAPVKAAAPKAASAKPAVKPVMPKVPHPLAAMASTVEYVLEDQVGFHLRRAHQRATAIFSDVMGPYDVTPTQFAALAKVDELGAVSQTFLGRLTGMDAATILGVVGRLLRQGLIVARAEPGDLRMTVLELSPKGRLSIDAMKRSALAVSAKTLSPLSPAEAKTLAQLLAKLM